MKFSSDMFPDQVVHSHTPIVPVGFPHLSNSQPNQMTSASTVAPVEEVVLSLMLDLLVQAKHKDLVSRKPLEEVVMGLRMGARIATQPYSVDSNKDQQ